nr:MAG: ORF1 [TTV-like mini virus]
MPYYRGSWWYPRRRRRRFWTRRPRQAIRRRFWRRKYWRHKVRRRRFKKKAKKITVRQWQPQKINKSYIKGIFPIFMCNNERRTNNMTQWLYSTAPTHYPSGGGFSITNWSLSSLYELHEKDTNWWTKSNLNLPLVRYQYCRFKLYRQWDYDYLFRYTNCPPMKASYLTFIGTQPSMMMMYKNTIFVPCLKNSRNKKPYKIVYVKPPQQMIDKWYFQHEFTTQPLVMTVGVAASFTRYYTSSGAISTTIGFKALNTNFFKFHNFQNPGTEGYMAKDKIYIWGVKNGEQNIQKVKAQNIVYLGNPGPFEAGLTLAEKYTNLSSTNFETNFEDYITHKEYWGNVFKPQYFTQGARIIYTSKSPSELKKILKYDTEIGTNFQQLTEDTVYECRYNPLTDTGEDTAVYLVPNIRDQTDWEPLNNKNLIIEGYPLWIALHGFLDYMKQLREVQHIDIDYITVIKSPNIIPKLHYYVVLDEAFIEGTSTYETQYHLIPSDEKHFYIKNRWQLTTLNTIGSSGPGTIKLPGTNSAEAHLEYKFCFKFGGCPAPMDTITNPENQPIYPVPSNILQKPSLQNPTTPQELYLYSFDQRRSWLTEKATKRISKDFDSKKLLLSTAGSSLQPAIHRESEETSSSQETSSSEEEKTPIQEQLNLQRRKQRVLKLKIKQLLKLIKNT